MGTTNHFKQRLKTQQQIGLWVGLANSYSAEIAAVAGYDWLLIDGEHAPNGVRDVLSQLQTIAGYETQAIVRPVTGSVHRIKQLLDLGAQTLLIPMVETAEQAELMVKAVYYPPKGIRGVGAPMARASRWNTIPDYLHKANENICLLIQIESVEGVKNLDAILQVDGIDGVFIGPADLSADMGHLGNPTHPDVQQSIVECIQKIRASGKAAGILSADENLAKQYLAMGTEFVAVGVDTSLLLQAMTQRLAKFKSKDDVNQQNQSSVY